MAGISRALHRKVCAQGHVLTFELFLEMCIESISAHQSEIQGAASMGNEFKPAYSDDWDAQEYANPPDAAPALPQAPADSKPALRTATIPNRPTPSPAAPAIARPVPRKANPRHFPGFIARSALFRASPSNDWHAQPTPVKAQGCKLVLSGPKLGMRDKHVWETAIQIAKERSTNVGDAFEIELRDFVRRMGSADFGGRALASIWESLQRLALCRVEFEIGDTCKGVGSLLATACRDGACLYLRLNADFAIPALLGDKQFLFDQARRKALPYALSQWLHDFFSTHKQARDMDLLYLRELCGYEGSPRNFPARLREAMRALIATAPELISSFEIDETGRSSDGWILRVVHGNDKPSFIQAERMPTEPKRGRGGVAL